MEVIIDRLSVTSGTNIWSKHEKLIVAKLKFSTIEHINLYLLITRIGKVMPSLLDHNHGGLIKELPTNSIRLFLTSTVSLIAKELQTLAGCRLEFEKGYLVNDSLYYSITEYEEEKSGIESMRASVKIINEVISGNEILDMKKILIPLSKTFYTQPLKRA